MAVTINDKALTPWKLAQSAKKALAAELLAFGKPNHLVAAELKVHRSTLTVWLHTPEFQRLIETRKREMAALVKDPTGFYAGLSEWSRELPVLMHGVLEIAKDSSNKKLQLAAVTLILNTIEKHLDFTDPATPTDDSKLITAYFQKQGWDESSEPSPPNKTG